MRSNFRLIFILNCCKKSNYFFQYTEGVCARFNPCKNGLCLSDNPTSVRCSCYSGWRGNTCNVRTTPNPCASNQCQNGDCQRLTDTTYRCNCRSGWTGRFCENQIQGPCRNNQCQNNGVCVPEQNSYRCQCVNGYTGQFCTIAPNRCANNECKNQATCRQTSQSYECVCRPGYTGRFCEEAGNPCGSSPCKNSATCVNQGPIKFACMCTHLFSGPTCEVSTTNLGSCTNNPCQFQGRCIQTIQGYRCNCPTGRVGKNCQMKIEDTCRIKNPCGSRGICRQGPLDVTSSCECYPGFSGPTCERRKKLNISSQIIRISSAIKYLLSHF